MIRKRIGLTLTGVAAVAFAAQYIAAAAGMARPVTGQRIVAADSEPGNWLSYGRTYDEQRFSPLTAVNDATVGGLGLAW